MSLLPCCRYYPAGIVQTQQPVFVCLYCLHLQIAGSASRVFRLRCHLCVYFRLRPDNLLITPKVTLSIGFRDLVTLLSAIQATGLLAFTLTGLSPVEHTSLSWTHNLVRNLLLGATKKINLGWHFIITLIINQKAFLNYLLNSVKLFFAIFWVMNGIYLKSFSSDSYLLIRIPRFV